jgi:AcrR family transcriptional regulator
VGRTITHSDSATRQEILRAALKSFAHSGFAAASVQDIVDAARVSKPALYYYFKDKAHLFEAVVDSAHEERFRVMRAAAGRGRTVGEQLEHVLADVFEYSLRNRELMRLAFATAFAAPGDAPARLKCREKGRRNYEFIRSLIERGQASGELDDSFTADEAAMGIYGQLNTYIMVRLLVPDCPLDAHTAKRILELFLNGAARKPKMNGQATPELRRHTTGKIGASNIPNAKISSKNQS